MKLTELFTDENAASPVVGIILVIGIVVILAASIGGVLFGQFEQTSETVPTANFEAEQGEKHLHATGSNEGDFPVLTIRHDSGDSINRSRLAVKVNGQKGWSVYRSSDCSPCHKTTDISGDGSLSTGGSITVAVKYHENLTEDMGFTMDSNTGSDIIVPTGGIHDVSDDDDHIQLEDGDTVELLWQNEDRTSSNRLFEGEVRTGI